MLTAFALLAASAAAAPLADGPIDIAVRGRYVCELPGDALGSASIRQEDEDFQIRSASRYSSEKGDGIYLLRGDVLRFTAGPRKGETYILESRTFMRRMSADGSPGRLRCVRAGR